MIFVELTDAELRQLPIGRRAQYWCDRYYHTRDRLDEAQRRLDIAHLQLRRIRDILGESK